jgi:hypothetical protein
LALVWRDLDLNFKRFEFWKIEMDFWKMEKNFWLTGLVAWCASARPMWALGSELRGAACDQVTVAHTASVVNRKGRNRESLHSLSTGGGAQRDAGEAATVVLDGVLGVRGNSPEGNYIRFGSRSSGVAKGFSACGDEVVQWWERHGVWLTGADNRLGGWFKVLGLV